MYNKYMKMVFKKNLKNLHTLIPLYIFVKMYFKYK